MNFSYFKPPIENIIPYREIDIEKVYELISSLSLKAVTDRFRALPAEDQDAFKKNNFPYATFSGVFESRSNEKLVSTSNLIAIDIDDLTLEEVLSAHQKLCKDKYTHLLFISPSGKGIKLIVKCLNVTKDNFNIFYDQIGSYIKENYNLNVCSGNKGISRATFLCYDVNVEYHKDSEIFNPTITSISHIDKDTIYASKPVHEFVEEMLPQWKKGKRQNLALYLAGAMRKAGYGIKTVDIVIEEICTMTNDEETEQRLSAVHSTFDKDITDIGGISKLKELLGPINKCIVATDLNVISLKDIIEKNIPAITWIIEDIVIESGITIIGAPPKTGKSLFAMSAALSCCTGGNFLSHFKTQKCKVLYVDEENGDVTMFTRFKHLNTDISTEDKSNVMVSIFNGLKLDDEKSVQLLSSTIKKYGVKLVIVDSMVRFMIGDEDKAKDVRIVFEGLKHIKLENPNVSFMILHHMSKTGSGQKGLRGSGEFSAFCDTIFTMENSGDDLILVTCENSRHMSKDKNPKFNIKIQEESGVLSLNYFEKFEKTTVIERCKKDIIRFLSDKNISEFETSDLQKEMNSLGHKPNAFHSAKNILLKDKLIQDIKRGKFKVDLDNLLTSRLSL